MLNARDILETIKTTNPEVYNQIIENIDSDIRNNSGLTIDIDYNINDGKKHRISPRGVSRDDLNKINFVKYWIK